MLCFINNVTTISCNDNTSRTKQNTNTLYNVFALNHAETGQDGLSGRSFINA